MRAWGDKSGILQWGVERRDRFSRGAAEPIQVADPPHPMAPAHVRGDVEFREVWFAYNPDDWVLKGIWFHVHPGESVAFVGATGAGKTSLISLISRFYDVQRGEVLVDGHNVKDLAQADLRRHVGA